MDKQRMNIILKVLSDKCLTCNLSESSNKKHINNFQVSHIKTLSLIMWLNRHFIMEPGPASGVKVQIIGCIMSLTRKLQVLES